MSRSVVWMASILLVMTASLAAAKRDGGYQPYRPKQPATLAMVGLGKMGGAMAERLLKGGHTVVAFDPAAAARAQVVQKGAVDAESLRAAVEKMPAGKRVVWVMVPAGKVTDEVIGKLTPMLTKGDVIIDGGNSNFADTLRRAGELKQHGIDLVDVGTSGGVWGAKRGYSLMIGGDRKVVGRLKPIFQTLAPGARTGWGHVGPTGAGHRAKMIHNGIEYGMMASLAEGLELASTGEGLKLDPAELTRIWSKGSVVSSWLVDLTRDGLKKNPTLAGFGSTVPDSGEGRWTVKDAVDRGVPIPTIAQALMSRFASQQEGGPRSGKFQQLMRNEFGGHQVVPEKKK
jgi:6-phosphogluconate dehydrogenase